MARRRARATAASLAVAMTLAAAVRLPRVLADDFPINDGGVFLVMIGEIAAGGLRLPVTTSYNDGTSPMAYPPLAFYAAAAIHRAAGVPVLALLRILPVAASLATVAAFFFLARALLGATWLATVAAMAFAVQPRSYEYMIMGGGLPRSFGFLFACIAVTCALRLAITRRALSGVAAAVALGLAMLSHPEMGLWAAASVALVGASRGLDRRMVVALAAVAAGAAVIAAPWWVVTLARHGLSPFVAAAHTSGWGLRSLLGLTNQWVVGEMGLAPLTMLAFVGALASLTRRALLLPAWLVLTFVVVPRSAPTPATVPVALLAARALVEVVVPLLARRRDRSRVAQPDAPGEGGAVGGEGPHPLLATAVMAPALAYTLLVSNLWRTPADWPALRRVPPEEREAMAWVAANIDREARFAVASGVVTWWVDPVDAWFPALSGRVSVATPNGAEWLPGGEFMRRVQAHAALQRCDGSEPDCLALWQERFAMPISHVYVSRFPTAGGPPRSAAVAGEGFTVLYSGPGALVLARDMPGDVAAPTGAPGPEGGGRDSH